MVPVAMLMLKLITQKEHLSSGHNSALVPAIAFQATTLRPKENTILANLIAICDKILDGFKKKWPEGVVIHKNEYLAVFSRGKWFELPSIEKEYHTLSNCRRCNDKHLQYQKVFPLKPVYEVPVPITVDTRALQ